MFKKFCVVSLVTWRALMLASACLVVFFMFEVENRLRWIHNDQPSRWELESFMKSFIPVARLAEGLEEKMDYSSYESMRQTIAPTREERKSAANGGQQEVVVRVVVDQPPKYSSR